MSIAAVIEAATTTANTGSPLMAAMSTRKKKKRSDIENAADAAKPGDKAEDAADLYSKAAKKVRKNAKGSSR